MAAEDDIELVINDDDLTETLLEETLEESHEFDEERQRSFTDTFKQVVTSIIIIFSSTVPVTTNTTTEFARLLFTYAFVVLAAYHLKTIIVLRAAVFYDIAGHYVHEFTVEMLDFVYRFAICIIISLARNFMHYTIDDVPFVIIGVAFYNMCSKIWVRHTQNRRMVYMVTTRNRPADRDRHRRRHNRDKDEERDGLGR